MLTLYPKAAAPSKKPEIPLPFTYTRPDVVPALGLTRPGTDRRQLLKAYTSWVFTCVSIRAEAMAKARYRAFMWDKTKTERVFLPSDHPAQQIIDNPNPYMTRRIFQFYQSCFLDLVGDSYSYIARDKLKVPRQLWPLPPDKVRPVPGTGNRLIDKYVLDFGGGQMNPITFDADEILHIRQPNPQSFIFGFSPTEAAAYMVDVNAAQNRYFRDFYEKDATPDGIITAPDGVELDADSQNEFVEQWIRWFGGPAKRRRVAFLDRGMKYEKMLVTAAEMQAAETSKTVREAIFAHFRVPLSKAGIGEGIIARSTIDAVNYTFSLDVIEPLVGNLEDQLKLDLYDVWFDPSIQLGHDNMVPADDQRQAEIDKINIQSGKTTLNEVRRREGRDAIAGGDEVIVQGRPTTLSAIASNPEMFATPAGAGSPASPAPDAKPAAEEDPAEAGE